MNWTKRWTRFSWALVALLQGTMVLGTGSCDITLTPPFCSTDAQCTSGSCLNGTCQPAAAQVGPLQWQWSNDQTVCKDPNGIGFLNQYPTVNVHQIVARNDESIYGVGFYTRPSQGLPSDYGNSLWGPGDYHINDSIKEGPHTFQLDVAPSGATASWSSLAQYSQSECFTNQCHTTCKGLTCLGGTLPVGPAIEPAGNDVVFFLQKLGYQRWASVYLDTSCNEVEFSKRESPQWSITTTEACIFDEFAFAGDTQGNVATCRHERLKKYDPSGTVLFDVPIPFAFKPTALRITTTGDIYGAMHSSTAVELARTDAAGTLVWAKTFSNPSPLGSFPEVVANEDGFGHTFVESTAYNTMDLAVDSSGNSILAFYGYETVDLGNGPMAPVGAKDIMLAKFDIQGNLMWAKRMGSGNFSPISFAMRRVGADDLALVVHFTGSVDLGDGLLQSSPVLIKYDGNGNLVWRADLLSLYPQPAPEVLSVTISGHPSGAIFVAGSGYGLASTTPDPSCDLGVDPQGSAYKPGTYPRPLRLFAAKYGP